MILALGSIVSCTTNQKQQADDGPVEEKKSDSPLNMMQSYICGLWSYDSANILNNAGYFFRSDGTIDFVGADLSGVWSLDSLDTLKIVYINYSDTETVLYKVKKMTADEMVLADTSGEYTFKKVPFGMNETENILTGFHGTLNPDESRDYNFDLPSAKRIRIKIKSPDDKFTMKVFDQFKEITSADVKQLQCIMVRSGKYKITVTNPAKKGNAGDFDLKVFSY